MQLCAQPAPQRAPVARMWAWRYTVAHHSRAGARRCGRGCVRVRRSSGLDQRCHTV